MTEVQGEGDREKDECDQVQIGCAVITSRERDRKKRRERKVRRRWRGGILYLIIVILNKTCLLTALISI